MPAILCPSCDRPLPADAPDGLCPGCLMRSALDDSLVSSPRAAGPAPAREALADALPRFEVLEQIGRGGMGVVYKARDTELDRLVAIKVLPPDLALDPAFVERFHREARVVAGLDHPNVVRLHDCGEHDDLLYLVLEYVPGQSLRAVLREGGVDPARALAIVEQVAAGLAYAHGQGVIHRDVKPENVLVGDDGRVRLVDFGLAKATEGGSLAFSLTGTRVAVGTPHYMAPEQLEDPERVDARADVYAVGVLAYELLTGRLPLGRFPAPSERNAVGAAVDAAVFICLAQEPRDRYADGAALHAAVRGLAAGPSKVALRRPTARPRRPSSRRLAARPSSPPLPDPGRRFLFGVGVANVVLFTGLLVWSLLVGKLDGTWGALCALAIGGGGWLCWFSSRASRLAGAPAPRRRGGWLLLPVAGVALGLPCLLFGLLVPSGGSELQAIGPLPAAGARLEVAYDEASAPFTTRPGERARRFRLDPFERSPVTEQAVVDPSALTPAQPFADEAARRRAWLIATGHLRDGIDPADAERAYHAQLHRLLADLPIEVLEEHFEERLYYGDVIDTADYLGQNALLVGEVGEGRGVHLGVVRTARANADYAAPPATMRYPSRIPSLRYWEPWGQVRPVPVDHQLLRERLTPDGLAVLLPELRDEPFAVPPVARAVLTGQHDRQLYVDPVAGRVLPLPGPEWLRQGGR